MSELNQKLLDRLEQDPENVNPEDFSMSELVKALNAINDAKAKLSSPMVCGRHANDAKEVLKQVNPVLAMNELNELFGKVEQLERDNKQLQAQNNFLSELLRYGYNENC